jgi:hypothetical protein
VDENVVGPVDPAFIETGRLRVADLDRGQAKTEPPGDVGVANRGTRYSISSVPTGSSP